MNATILRRMQEQFNGCPLFEGREKGSLDELVGKKVKIEAYYQLTGDNGPYFAIWFKGINDKFYLSSGAITDLIMDYEENSKEVDILIQEKVATNSGNEFRPIKVF